MSKLHVLVGSLIILVMLTSTALSAPLAQTPPLTIPDYPDGILPSGNVGALYGVGLTTTGGGERPVTWSITNGKLPAGLSIIKNLGNSSTAIQGTPTREETATFTVQARDRSGNRTTRIFTLTIGPALPLLITNPNSTLPGGTVGVDYATNLFANGGLQPYDWAIIAGELPPGLRLRRNQINGTPTMPGTFIFTAQVTDDLGGQATKEFSITIN